MSHVVIPFPGNKTTLVEDAFYIPSFVKKLASSLMICLEIKEGVELVNIIGNGDEHSNQKAIETWLMNQYTEESFLTMETPLSTLARALALYISDNYYDNQE